MTVNDKMVKEVGKLLTIAASGMVDLDEDAYTAQAVIDAAWTKFDPDDESTWPKVWGSYVCIYGGKVKMIYWKTVDETNKTIWSKVTHYADPQVFMPSL